MNPAELVSIGITPCADFEYWFDGPQFLIMDGALWTTLSETDSPPDIEPKQMSGKICMTLEDNSVQLFPARLSDWLHLLESIS